MSVIQVNQWEVDKWHERTSSLDTCFDQPVWERREQTEKEKKEGEILVRETLISL